MLSFEGQCVDCWPKVGGPNIRCGGVSPAGAKTAVCNIILLHESIFEIEVLL